LPQVERDRPIKNMTQYTCLGKECSTKMIGDVSELGQSCRIPPVRKDGGGKLLSTVLGEKGGGWSGGGELSLRGRRVTPGEGKE